MRRFDRARCIVAGRSAVADAVAARLDGEPRELAREIVAAAAVEAGVTRLGGADVLVTAFTSREDRHFLEIDDELWGRLLDENLKSTFLVTREVARRMSAGAGGVVVHVGSDLGARPGPGTAAYAAAKAGVHLFSMVTALDLVPHGVRVCCVATPEDGDAPGRAMPPDHDDVAASVAFCASGEASYVLGSTFFLDGPLPVRG